MFEAVRFNLANLVNFSGRDSRSTFWFYVLFLAIVYFAVAMVIYIAVAGGMFMSMMRQAQASGGPDDAVIQASMGHWMSRTMAAMVWFAGASAVVGTGLLAASFTRRLHDSGKPGWIAGVVLGVYLASVVLMIATMGDYVGMFEKIDFNNPGSTQQLMVANQQTYAARGLLSWIPMVALLVFGIWPSSDGDNRYGAEPEHL